MALLGTVNIHFSIISTGAKQVSILWTKITFSLDYNNKHTTRSMSTRLGYTTIWTAVQVYQAHSFRDLTLNLTTGENATPRTYPWWNFKNSTRGLRSIVHANPSKQFFPLQFKLLVLSVTSSSFLRQNTELKLPQQEGLSLIISQFGHYLLL